MIGLGVGVSSPSLNFFALNSSGPYSNGDNRKMSGDECSSGVSGLEEPFMDSEDYEFDKKEDGCSKEAEKRSNESDPIELSEDFSEKSSIEFGRKDSGTKQG